ncbi:hypothetical protein F511_00203 [Dorcoceras hygrometricum]|nr:hypothetical protein F511_00203 [Dorcoceras hygrometricum]
MVELAALRGSTSRPDSWKDVDNFNPDSENREGGIGWPGMMSIRVHELDGMYDHPILPMTGEPWQLLEIQCHSKLAAKRFQKTKKGLKADGSDDNGDAAATSDVRLNSDSPLLWLKADPEMEYLAEVHFNQPVQMWINQLEKDKDVTAQAQAIGVLETLPQLPFSVVNALSNFLSDSKAIPHAIAMVRSSDKKSPRESVEFILQLLKYNDNNGNTYSDVFWLAALIRSVGELEFGQQSIIYLPSLLKRLDRLLQFDRTPTLYGVPRDETLRMGHTKTSNELKNIFAALIKQSIPTEPSSVHSHVPLDLEGQRGTDSENLEPPEAVLATPGPDRLVTLGVQMTANAPSDPEQRNSVLLLPKDDLMTISKVQVLPEGQESMEPVTNFLDDNLVNAEVFLTTDAPSNINEGKKPVLDSVQDSLIPVEATKEVDTVSNSHEPKKPKLRIRVKQSAASSRAEDPRNARTIKSQDGHNDADRGASSSVSVDAPPRIFAETISTSNQNFEDANSCHDVGSRVTASIDSAKPTIDGEDLVKELQCTADSSIVILQLQPDNNIPSSTGKTDTDMQTGEHTVIAPFNISRKDADGSAAGINLHISTEDKEKRKSKKSKRKRDGHTDDPEHVERKRLKKEKKRKEKEMAKLLALKSQFTPVELASHEKRIATVNMEDKTNRPGSETKEQWAETSLKAADVAGAAASSAGTKYMEVQSQPAEPNKVIVLPDSGSTPAPQSTTSRKIKIKLKNRTLGKP